MPLLVSDCLDEASYLLNDGAKTFSSYAATLPFFRKAYAELESELIDAGHPQTMEIAAPQTVAAGALVLPSPPTNMIEPIKLEERTPASTVDYTPMKRRLWEPNAQQDVELRFWTWREGAVVFLGATTDRSVRLYYLRMLATIVDQGSTVEVINAKTFLASRTAAIYAFVVLQDAERAQGLGEDAADALYRLVGSMIKNRQSLPARRRPYRCFRRFPSR